MHVKSIIPSNAEIQPLIDYLANRFTYLSAAEWTAVIGQQHVWVNGRLATSATHIHPRDELRCELPDVVPEGVPLEYDTIYEDEWLIGINKPSNLRVHSSGKFVQANLIYLVRQTHPTAQLINRLDADTSGVLLVAKDKQTASAVGGQFAAGTVQKQYLALVHGSPNPAAGTIDLPIGKINGKQRPTRHGVLAVAHGGKTAVTHYTTRQTCPNQITMLQLNPKTGRTHQIRVHLAALGHPILSDKLYSFTPAQFGQWTTHRTLPAQAHGLRHHALHCQQTTILHPQTKQPLPLSAPPPTAWRPLLNGANTRQ